jgi:hypothetical protein
MRGIVEIFLSKILNCVKFSDASAQRLERTFFLFCLCRVEKQEKRKKRPTLEEKDAGVEERGRKGRGARIFIVWHNLGGKTL